VWVKLSPHVPFSKIKTLWRTYAEIDQEWLRGNVPDAVNLPLVLLLQRFCLGDEEDPDRFEDEDRTPQSMVKSKFTKLGLLVHKAEVGNLRKASKRRCEKSCLGGQVDYKA
jgi:hypothetical protein